MPFVTLPVAKLPVAKLPVASPLVGFSAAIKSARGPRYSSGISGTPKNEYNWFSTVFCTSSSPPTMRNMTNPSTTTGINEKIVR